jgi:hypothetical protein
VPARADEENSPVHVSRTGADVFDDFALSGGSSRPHGQSPHSLLSGTASGAADERC